jgi:hypothetical protein
VSWTSAPLESLLNVEKLINVWKSKGLMVYRVSCMPVLRIVVHSSTSTVVRPNGSACHKYVLASAC